MPRTGRRPGPSTTRAAILEVARAQFAQAGYDGTSLRAVAAEAGVDTGVVQHFFGSKDELFRAVVGWPFDPGRLEAELGGRSARGLGRRLARAFFSYWEDPTTGAALVAVLRSATTHSESAVFLREFVTQRLFARIAARIDAPDADHRVELGAPRADLGVEIAEPHADLRAEIEALDAKLRVELAAGQLIGVAMLRYILKVEPVASASIDELIARLAPGLNRQLRAPSKRRPAER